MYCVQMGDHGVSGQHKYQLEEAQRAEKRVSQSTFTHGLCCLMLHAVLRNSMS